MKVVHLTIAVGALALSACGGSKQAEPAAGAEQPADQAAAEPAAAEPAAAEPAAEQPAEPASADEAAPAEAAPADEAGAEGSPEGAKVHQEVTVEQLATWVNEGQVTVCDANNATTRAEFGVIPGAILLTRDADVTTQLPEDKNAQLVFYCANEVCQAAPKAAQAAAQAGYTNVSVLPSGIKGWVDAGQETKPAPQG